jgi:hypothetical protein
MQVLYLSYQNIETLLREVSSNTIGIEESLIYFGSKHHKWIIFLGRVVWASLEAIIMMQI